MIDVRVIKDSLFLIHALMHEDKYTDMMNTNLKTRLLRKQWLTQNTHTVDPPLIKTTQTDRHTHTHTHTHTQGSITLFLLGHHGGLGLLGVGHDLPWGEVRVGDLGHAHLGGRPPRSTTQLKHGSATSSTVSPGAHCQRGHRV